MHDPPRIHAPPARLRVAAAMPWTPEQRPGTITVSQLVVGADGSTGDRVADAALRSAATVDAVLATRFGRDGIDGHGGTVELVVHAPDRTNAYWDGDARRVELGDGDGVRWGAFAESVSVMAHELYHGVIDAEVRLDYEQTEQAALHESLADVFASAVVGSWNIGMDVITPGVAGDSIRDLAHPTIRHLRESKGAAGVAHVLSGVASLAAVHAAEAIGTDSMQQVWYQALRDHLHDGAGFSEAARATVAAAAALYGGESRERTAVLQAWESVGVRPG